MIEGVGEGLLWAFAAVLVLVVAHVVWRAWADERGITSYHPHRRALRTLARINREGDNQL